MGINIEPREYALHSNAVYIKPAHPGPLVIPAGTTLHMVNTMQDQHKECQQVAVGPVVIPQLIK